jgi:hypothetical protein
VRFTSIPDVHVLRDKTISPQIGYKLEPICRQFKGIFLKRCLIHIGGLTPSILSEKHGIEGSLKRCPQLSRVFDRCSPKHLARQLLGTDSPARTALHGLSTRSPIEYLLYGGMKDVPSLQGPKPAEFQVWIHQMCGPLLKAVPGVTEQVVPLQLAWADVYHVLITLPFGPSTHR